ncbi:MAG: phospholipase D-like domain-containing protein [Nanobdellota archaeon]
MNAKRKRVLLYSGLVVLYLIFLLVSNGNLHLNTETTEFTDTGSADYFSCHDHDCAYILNTLLNQSREARCAFYELDHSLITLPDHVETLIYEENHEGTTDSSVKAVPSKGLMHHKFCIFNNKTVLTGTWNPTMRGTYVNDNSIVLIRSKVIAELYDKEFERLEARIDSSMKMPSHPQSEYHINLSGTPIRLCFSPVQDCEGVMIEELRVAEEEIRILAFMLTSDAVGDTLARLTGNVTIQGVFEATGVSRYSEYEKLLDAGATIYKDGNSAFMHQKLMVLDEEKLLIGSYNPTKNARERNDENLLIIKDRSLASSAIREYERIMTIAQG